MRNYEIFSNTTSGIRTKRLLNSDRVTDYLPQNISGAGVTTKQRKLLRNPE
ncbi:hypothetical protein VCRA2120O333_20299 [Vibrio crassostreae]|nr:hypothetical protein VCRA2121O334_20299 [Vibrio crassostreae]CAK3558507.1 hypothetical protein VCRA2122O341_40042 [Vibrio crassostreae]CAK3868459.1 hypothetical protein VCRA2120O333_20299 [Vibrio crassostreae]